MKKLPFRNTSLPLETRLNDLISRLTLNEKIRLIPTRQAEIKRLGIKEFFVGAEGAHGFVDRKGQSTTFPQTIGLSSSWNRELLYKIGEIIGQEARSYFNKKKIHGLSLWFPTIDMEKDPRWGRNEESYGEDPYLTGELASQIIAGTQGNDPFYIKASCAPKHFFANNTEKNRVNYSASIDPRNLHEYYLQPFKRVFCNKNNASRPYSLMTSYNEVNGIPMMSNPILNDVVKNAWGFQGRGHFVTDGGDVIQNVTEHKYFNTHEESISDALKNGADSMTDNKDMIIEALAKAIETGLLTEEELDKHVKDILRIRFKFGHFDPEVMCPYDTIDDSYMMTKEANDLARISVQESIVMLKNENNILPIDAQKKPKIAVIGPLADKNYLDWYAGNPSYTISPLQGLIECYGKDSIIFENGNDVVSFSTEDDKPLILDNDGFLVPSVNKEEKAARFTRDNWGWGANTLFADSEFGGNNRYLNMATSMPANHQPSQKELEEFRHHTIPGRLNANAEHTREWFVMTLHNIIQVGESTKTNNTETQNVYIRTWNGTSVKQDQDGNLISYPSEIPDLFKMKIEKDGIQKAVEVAKQADVTLLFLGNNPNINAKEEVDRDTLELPPYQQRLLESVKAANPNTVLILVTGYPYSLENHTDNLPGILVSPHGMQEFGHGLADVISGRTSPSGRLPMTWYKNDKALKPMMEYDIISSNNTYQYFNDDVLYPFGHGLTYSSFEYSDLSITDLNGNKTETISKDNPIIISFNLKNTGKITAKEVSQLYISIKNSRVKRPLIQLKSFDKIELEPNQEKTISFTVEANELEIWDVTREQYCLENTTAILQIGSSSKDIKLKSEIKVDGETIPPRNLQKNTFAQNYDEYDGVFLHERKGTSIPAVFTYPWLNSFHNSYCKEAKNEYSQISFKDCEFTQEITHFTADISTQGKANIEILSNDKVILSQELPNTGDICAVPGDQLRPAWTIVTYPIQDIFKNSDITIRLYGKIGIHQFRFF